VYFIN